MTMTEKMKQYEPLMEKLFFWIGGIFAALYLLFYVLVRIRILGLTTTLLGLLFVILVMGIYVLGIIIITFLLDILKENGYFTPITRFLIYLILLSLVSSVTAIGNFLIQAIVI